MRRHVDYINGYSTKLLSESEHDSYRDVKCHVKFADHDQKHAGEIVKYHISELHNK